MFSALSQTLFGNPLVTPPQPINEVRLTITQNRILFCIKRELEEGNPFFLLYSMPKNGKIMPSFRRYIPDSTQFEEIVLAFNNLQAHAEKHYLFKLNHSELNDFSTKLEAIWTSQTNRKQALALFIASIEQHLQQTDTPLQNVTQQRMPQNPC